MKRFAMLLLGLMLCLAVFTLPAAAEDATEPEPTTQTQEEPTEPEPTTQTQEEAPVYSPYELLDLSQYSGDYFAYDNACRTWEKSLCGRYYQWSRNYFEERRPQFDPAFRAFYADDPELLITDHFVYKKVKDYEYEGRKRVWHTYAVIYDYFDTDAAAAGCTTLRIPAEIDGCRVKFFMVSNSFDTGEDFDSGYTNDTVKKLVVEEGVKTIAPFAFSHFTALKTLSLPRTLELINVGAFNGCTALKTVTGCEGLQRVMSSAFAGCKSLYHFDNMEQLLEIEGAAFDGCAFRSLTLSGSIWLGGGNEDYYTTARSFGGCEKLKKVTFLSGDKTKWLMMEEGTFAGCTNLKTVVLPKTGGDIEIGDKAFYGCTALKTIKNTGLLRWLGRSVFEGCDSLAALVVPDGFRYGASDTFLGSSLKKLYINSKNEKLFDGDHPSDDFMYVDGKPVKITKNILTCLPKTCTVYVVDKTMKYVVKKHDFKGTVKIQVPVSAPKTVKAVKQNGKVTVKWSKVKVCDGYRVWAYNEKTGKYQKLATVKGNVTSVTVRSNAKQFAVRAFRSETGDVSWSKLKTCTVS